MWLEILFALLLIWAGWRTFIALCVASADWSQDHRLANSLYMLATWCFAAIPAVILWN